MQTSFINRKELDKAAAPLDSSDFSKIHCYFKMTYFTVIMCNMHNNSTTTNKEMISFGKSNESIRNEVVVCFYGTTAVYINHTHKDFKSICNTLQF